MVSGVTGGTTGGFTSGGTVTGSSTGFTTGTTVTGSTSAGYTIGADGTVRDASGTVIGRMNGAGDVVNSAGVVVVRGLSTTSTGSISGGSAAGGYTIGADGSVRDASGRFIGTMNGAGDVVGSNGSIVLRGLGGTSGGSFSSGSFSSGSVGSTVTGGMSAGGMSAGDFQVRADGSVVSRSTGAVIGTVDGSGNIVNAAGSIIGRVTR
jgi:hypothetical protein